jgi:hypothetical protein
MLISCVSYALVELPLESGKRKSEMEGKHWFTRRRFRFLPRRQVVQGHSMVIRLYSVS